MKPSRAILSLLWLSSTALAQGGLQLMDNRSLYMIDVEELEFADLGGHNDLAWDAEWWAGTDVHKLWVKTKGEKASSGQDHAELQILYSRAIAPFWNLQAGLRRELDPKPDHDSAVLAIEGLAPYGFGVEAELFFGGAGRSSARLRTDYELLLTQRLILTPEAEVTIHAQADELRGSGSGLSRAELGLRLRYEIRREVAPYIGLRWIRLLGQTEDLAVLRGHDADDVEFVAGLRFWY